MDSSKNWDDPTGESSSDDAAGDNDESAMTLPDTGVNEIETTRRFPRTLSKTGLNIDSDVANNANAHSMIRKTPSQAGELMVGDKTPTRTPTCGLLLTTPKSALKSKGGFNSPPLSADEPDVPKNQRSKSDSRIAAAMLSTSPSRDDSGQDREGDRDRDSDRDRGGDRDEHGVLNQRSKSDSRIAVSILAALGTPSPHSHSHSTAATAARQLLEAKDLEPSPLLPPIRVGSRDPASGASRQPSRQPSKEVNGRGSLFSSPRVEDIMQEHGEGVRRVRSADRKKVR
jgi:hypothetical protein